MKPIPLASRGYDFNLPRITFARLIQSVTALYQQRVMLEEPEVQNQPRPEKPYFSFKFTTPAAKFGDDSKDPVLDSDGNATTVTNSGGVRMMSVSFNAYGRTHEEAYNYMIAWQCALDREDIQEVLRSAGIAVWTIGAVADLSQLLNTGYEGRSHMDCTFGFAVNTQSDTGRIEKAPVQGHVDTNQSVVEIDVEVTV